MKHLSRISSLSLIVFVVSLFVATPVLAIPPLPSSFYGMVKVNSANVPDGTVIQTLIGGQVYAEGYTQTYQGNSVYALDVRGDDSGTATVDGGREGETIQLEDGRTPAGRSDGCMAYRHKCQPESDRLFIRADRHAASHAHAGPNPDRDCDRADRPPLSQSCPQRLPQFLPRSVRLRQRLPPRHSLHRPRRSQPDQSQPSPVPAAEEQPSPASCDI